MKTIIKQIVLQNFKGCEGATHTFDGKNATVCGANGSGKTTIFDAFTWLLFGKDSLDNAKFEVRPLDTDGNQIDNVEICVAATLEIDGKKVELRKIQKQNWVKKRGSENPTLQGNVNEYEIDGYPRSAKDYEEYINSIVSDDLFKMLTNPAYFPNMPWKEQRSTIMKFASEVSDIELATEDSRFDVLIDELSKAPSTDDIKNKYQKSLNELKKKQAELPVRIDEVSKNKVDIDVAELELQRNALIEHIAENKAKQDDVSKQFEEYQKMSDGIMELKFAEGDLQRNANEELEKKRRELRNKEYELCRNGDKTNSDIGYKKTQIHNCELHISDLTKDLEKAREEYTSASKMEFDENDLTCKMCGQPYPAEKTVEIRMDFQNRKNDILHRIAKKGNSAKGKLQEEKDILQKSKEQLENLEKSLESIKEELEKVREEMRKLPTSIDISGTEEYKVIQSQIAEKEQAMSQMNNADEIRQTLKAKSEDLQSKLTEVEKQIALSENNLKIDERIEELQAEQREVAQKIADQEKILYLLDEFIKYKLDKISDSINAMFDGISFKLFDIQLNGGVKEVCECTVNGVPYGSLNNGHRIIAGLQIIKALQKLYGAYLPIFIDNAESVNDFNLPDMDCQIIALKVTDSNELKVEKER